MANIKLNMSNEDYTRIETAFLQQFVGDPETIAGMTSQQKKDLVNNKVAEYVANVTGSYERVLALEATVIPTPPVVTPE